MAGIGFVPDDRPVRLDGEAVGENRLGEGVDHGAAPSGASAWMIAGVGIGGIIGPGVGEDEPAVGREHEVVGAVEPDPADFGEQDLRDPAFAHALDRGDRHLGGAPGAAGAAVLAEIERAVGAAHAGIGRARDISEAPRRAVGADHRQLAAIALDQGEPPVGQQGRPLRPAEPGGDEFGRRASLRRHRILSSREARRSRAAAAEWRRRGRAAIGDRGDERRPPGASGAKLAFAGRSAPGCEGAAARQHGGRNGGFERFCRGAGRHSHPDRRGRGAPQEPRHDADVQPDHEARVVRAHADVIVQPRRRPTSCASPPRRRATRCR